MNNIYMLTCININYHFNKKFERMLKKSVRTVSGSEIIDVSHSLLDTSRSYGEGAMKVIWFWVTLSLLRNIPQNFESREKRYADIYHLFKKYNLP